MINFRVNNAMEPTDKRVCLEQVLNVQIVIATLTLEVSVPCVKIVIVKTNSYPVLSFIIRQALDSREPIVLLNVDPAIQDEFMEGYPKIARSVILILSKVL